MTVARSLKPVVWLGNTKEDLSALAEDVRDEVGQALYEAQKGGKHPSVKPLSGFGDASVLEVVSDYNGDTFRAVYTVRWPAAVYVLHVFQKKSKSGIKTPRGDMNLVEARLKRLREALVKAEKRKKGGTK